MIRALWLAVLLVPASTASAHLGLISPPSRYGPTVLKYGPCGQTGGARSENVTVFAPGETIEVVWDEYVDHPGHYRVAFDPDGDDDFVDPATMTETYSNDAVLLDGIEDRAVTSGDSEYRVTVTLPDVECDNCTLQVVQVMYDKPPYTVGGNDLYYQCADLILRRAPGDDAGATSDAGGGARDGGTVPVDAGGVPGADGGHATMRDPADDSGCSAAGPRGRSSATALGVGVGVGVPLLLALRRRRSLRASGARPSPRD